MRECSFHLPIMDNSGAHIGAVVYDAIKACIDQFGGATVTDAQGFWLDDGQLYDEPVKRITVAVPTITDVERVKNLALEYGRRAHQLAVYFVDAFGEAETIDVREQVKEAA